MPIRDALLSIEEKLPSPSSEQNGFNSVEACDIKQAKENIVEPYPDLILLDWMLPGGTGVKLAQTLKQNEFTRNIPIIMLTARADEDDKVKGLDAGVDDYVTKPFSPKELIARIKAVIRRVSPTLLAEKVEFHGLKLDPVSHQVTINNEALELGPTEFRLLHFFMTHTERVYSREQLLNNVWGTNVYVEDRTVDVHIRRLRKAISGAGHEEFIQTVRGAGYRFSGKVKAN
jgi:two-component system phosphate regulon response regulator PhoB